MLPLRGAALALAAAGALATTTPTLAAAPTTYGITPGRGGLTTGITATFSFKTASAGECTSQQVRFYWDGAYWGSAATSWIQGNGTCTGNATLQPPSGAQPGIHHTTAGDSSGADTSTGPANFVLLNPDGSTPAATVTGTTPPASGGDGFPVVAVVVLVVLAIAAIAGALFVGRGRRGAATSRR